MDTGTISKITYKEKRVLQGIVNSEFLNGAKFEAAEVVDFRVWTFSARPKEYNQQQFRGVLSSLSQKELIKIESIDAPGDSISITQLGFDTLKEAEKEAEKDDAEPDTLAKNKLHKKIDKALFSLVEDSFALAEIENQEEARSENFRKAAMAIGLKDAIEWVMIFAEVEREKQPKILDPNFLDEYNRLAELLKSAANLASKIL